MGKRKVIEWTDSAGNARATVMSKSLQTALLKEWPLERPVEQELSREVQCLFGAGFLYIEAIGAGWRRIGLTQDGRDMKARLGGAR